MLMHNENSPLLLGELNDDDQIIKRTVTSNKKETAAVKYILIIIAYYWTQFSDILAKARSKIYLPSILA